MASLCTYNNENHVKTRFGPNNINWFNVDNDKNTAEKIPNI